MASASSPAKTTTPFLSNMNDTEPDAPMFPPFLPKAERTLAAVRFTFEVSVSTINIEPFGPKPS